MTTAQLFTTSTFIQLDGATGQSYRTSGIKVHVLSPGAGVKSWILLQLLLYKLSPAASNWPTFQA